MPALLVTRSGEAEHQEQGPVHGPHGGGIEVADHVAQPIRRRGVQLFDHDLRALTQPWSKRGLAPFFAVGGRVEDVSLRGS
jgi:hypothetical protein